MDLRQRRAPARRPRTPGDAPCRRLLRAPPTIASKRWAFEQYDSIVQSRTVRRPEQADAAVLQLARDGHARSRSRSTATAGGSPATPTPGTIEAVLECAQNLACVGAEPLGLTNCLNFGNPEKPTVAWQLDRSTQALADACTALGVPVVGGNVSLYNETDRGRSTRRPVVGMVGELPVPRGPAGHGPARAATRSRSPGRSRRRSPARSWRSSAASSARGWARSSSARSARRSSRSARRSAAGRVHVAHDISDGGLACALAEMRDRRRGRPRGRPGAADRRRAAASAEAWLFGEGPGGFVLAGEVSEIERLVEAGTAVLIGVAGGEAIRIAAGELPRSSCRCADAERLAARSASRWTPDAQSKPGVDASLLALRAAGSTSCLLS